MCKQQILNILAWKFGRYFCRQWCTYCSEPYCVRVRTTWRSSSRKLWVSQSSGFSVALILRADLRDHARSFPGPWTRPAMAHAGSQVGAGERHGARVEFQKALNLDRTSMEARAGLISVRGEPRHEMRFGQDNDLFNFTSANHDGWASLVSQWTPHWATSFAGSFYERAGIRAGKFSGAITGRLPRWGALTVGGAAGHDNAVIPKSEAFFDVIHGWKASETNFLRAVEFVYGQHWYWYQASRILTLNGTAIVYLPRDSTLSLGATGVLSTFSGTGAEWRPSGITRLGFPLVNWGEKRLSGSVFLHVGTEDFAQIDQIGRFASQTYGGGLRFQINARQDVTGYASYQKRTQDRTDTSFGLSYGIHF